MVVRGPDGQTSACDLIWMRPARRRRGQAPSLSREQIVAACLELADEHGMGGVSMRAIAAKLGAGPMSLYWYVKSKSDLVDLMLDAVFAQQEVPGVPSGDWRKDLRAIARQMRAVLRRHPWATPLLGTRPHLGPGAIRHMEVSLSALAGLGLDPITATGIHGTIDFFVGGFVLHECRAEDLKRHSGMNHAAWLRAISPYLRQVLASGTYPTVATFFAQVVEHGAPVWEPDPDAQFEFGLDCLLRGIADRIGAAPAGDPDGRQGT